MKIRVKKYTSIVMAVVIIMSLFSGCKTKREDNNAKKTLPEKLNFDFGVDSEFTADGWTAVTVNKKGEKAENVKKGYIYSESKGYGFKTDKELTGRKEVETEPAGYTLPKEVYMDYVLAKGEEFVVDVANGTYMVQIVVGTISESTTTVNVEGVDTPKMGTAKKYVITTLTNIKVSDGQMNFKISGNGAQGGLVNAISIVQVDMPSLADVHVENGTVKLAWNEAQGADAYNLYRTDRLGNTVVFRDIRETLYIDEEVEWRETYAYSITGVTAAGAESERSDSTVIWLTDDSVAKPDVPANFTVSELTETGTVLTWEASEGADIYEVYMSDRKGVGGLTGYKLIGKTDKTTLEYEASTYNRKYYKVIAGNNGGYSDCAEVMAQSGSNLSVQLEYQDRNAVAVKTDAGVYISWKLSVDEYEDEREFELYRDGVLVESFSGSEACNYIDAQGAIGTKYVIKAVKDGKILNETDNIDVWEQQYIDIPLQKPEPMKMPDGSMCTYHANDISPGDVDGDGIYEYFVKWEPDNAQDNSKPGYTGNVYIDCYKLEGTLLWRIDIGRNIRAGAHYTQMTVFDFDGDASAEIILKTSDATVDGTGAVIGNADADYRNESGYILTGNEYLTLFDGRTGRALDTIDYKPGRGNVNDWGDGYGNRVDRFLSAVAYLDGEKPSAVICRGYYTRAVLVAYDVVDKKLVEKWVCDSNDAENRALAGQGAHYATSADVDGDGYDEIVYGAATVDHDGKLLYAIGDVNGTGGGHGDAIHITDMNLDNPGLEIFMVHESYPNDAGIEMHDGATGRYLINIYANTDVGRGASADIDPNHKGVESWATGTDAWNAPKGYLLAANGEVITDSIPAANFVIWWDGDLGREILDHKFSSGVGAGTPTIYKWDWENCKSKEIMTLTGTYSNNYTKGTPALQADLLGDWREEIVVRTTDSSALRIYTTVDYTENRIYTLMHDVQYRCQVASQNVAYNQPPHTSFYIGFDSGLMEIPVRRYHITGK